MKNLASKFAAALLLAATLRAAEPDAATLFRQAETAFKQQNYSQALSLLRTFLDKYPDSKQAVRAWEYVAQCENALGDPMAAFEAYQKIWERHKDFAKLSVITRNQMKIGNYFLKQKQYDNAIKVYEKILENAPQSDVAPGAQYSLAQAYLGNEDYAAARAELSKLIRNYPTSQLVDDAMFDLGYIAYLQSKEAPYDQSATSEAIAAFRTFISNFPSSPKVPEAQQYIRILRSRKAAALFRTAEFYENIRVPKAARITYREVIEQYPDTPYAEEARRRLAGAEHQPVEEPQSPSPTFLAALNDSSPAPVSPASQAPQPAPGRTSSRPTTVTPISARATDTTVRTIPSAASTDTLRERSARRVAQLKSDPKGREALRAAMKQAYTEELRRSRSAKAALHASRAASSKAPQTTAPAPTPPSPRPTSTSTFDSTARVASHTPGPATLLADEFAFEVDTNDIRISFATADSTPATPAEQTSQAPTAARPQRRPRMIVEYEHPRDSSRQPQTPPPAVPIEGPSFDDLLAGRVLEQTEAPASPAQDWQPFVDSSKPVLAPPTTPAATAEFIVVGLEPLDSAKSLVSQTAPSTPRSAPSARADESHGLDVLAQATESVTAPAPQTLSTDFIVGSLESLSTSAQPPSTTPQASPQPAQTSPSPQGAAPARTETAPQKSAPRRQKTRSVPPATMPAEPHRKAEKQATQPPSASPTTAATTSPVDVRPAPASTNITIASPSSPEPPELEHARREEQARAALTRRRLEAIREQAGRDEITLRQITPDGRVRRAQYDETVTAAAETPYNHEQLQREYAAIYYLIKRGDAAFQQGLANEAKQHYGNALDRLLKLKANAPTWQSDIVNFRIDYCRERLRSIQ